MYSMIAKYFHPWIAIMINAQNSYSNQLKPTLYRSHCMCSHMLEHSRTKSSYIDLHNSEIMSLTLARHPPRSGRFSLVSPLDKHRATNCGIIQDCSNCSWSWTHIRPTSKFLEVIKKTRLDSLYSLIQASGAIVEARQYLTPGQRC